jgi:hypothetical protein
MATTEGAKFTSKLAEEAIAEGLVVVPGDTNPATTCRLSDEAGEINGTIHTAWGISVLDPYRTASAYADGEEVLICTEGEIWVNVVTNASLVGGAVFCVVASGTIDGTTGTAIPGAKFLTAGTGLQKIRLASTSI